MAEGIEKDETTKWHWLLFAPTFLLLAIGIIIGCLICPLIKGVKVGYRNTNKFWNFDLLDKD